MAKRQITAQFVSNKCVISVSNRVTRIIRVTRAIRVTRLAYTIRVTRYTYTTRIACNSLRFDTLTLTLTRLLHYPLWIDA